MLEQTGVSNKSLELFLASNKLTKLPQWLWQLNNLKVLSLRNNKLKFLPPDIHSLKNLVELSVGNNLLTSLPLEILGLPNLKILNINPNPFVMPLSSSSDSTDFYQMQTATSPSYLLIRRNNHPSALLDLAARQCTSANLFPLLSRNLEIPVNLFSRVSHAMKTNRCVLCGGIFFEPEVVFVIWHSELLQNKCIPLLVRLCSTNCWKNAEIDIYWLDKVASFFLRQFLRKKDVG